jgi:hypothetical protein
MRRALVFVALFLPLGCAKREAPVRLHRAPDTQLAKPEPRLQPQPQHLHLSDERQPLQAAPPAVEVDDR